MNFVPISLSEVSPHYTLCQPSESELFSKISSWTKTQERFISSESELIKDSQSEINAFSRALTLLLIRGAATISLDLEI